jgi:hypothetical protein
MDIPTKDGFNQKRHLVSYPCRSICLLSVSLCACACVCVCKWLPRFTDVAGTGSLHKHNGISYSARPPADTFPRHNRTQPLHCVGHSPCFEGIACLQKVLHTTPDLRTMSEDGVALGRV